MLEVESQNISKYTLSFVADHLCMRNKGQLLTRIGWEIGLLLSTHIDQFLQSCL